MGSQVNDSEASAGESLFERVLVLNVALDRAFKASINHYSCINYYRLINKMGNCGCCAGSDPNEVRTEKKWAKSSGDQQILDEITRSG